MKKVLFTILFLFALAVPVSAANGDIVGNIYSTDIRAYINDVEVKSYNIGGKTAVVIEDILGEGTHAYVYNNDYRVLSVNSLDPDMLVESKAESAARTGEIEGNIYETDIKTHIYNAVLPSYNIGGKTAVVIEDLGDDGAFSPIGGRYVWNGTDRTIKLEFMYKNTPGDTLRGNNIRITANEDLTEGEAVFEEIFSCCTGAEHFNWPENLLDSTNIELVFPIKADGEIIGYYLRRATDDYFTAFNYYYPEKAEAAAKNHIPLKTTKEEILNHFASRHGNSPMEQFDTADYSFAFYKMAFVGGAADYLVQAYSDGTYKNYMDEIRVQGRTVRDLVIDKTNQKVTFRYEDRRAPEWFTNYEIDLKTGTIAEK